MTTTHLNDLFDRMEPEIGNELDDKIQVIPNRTEEIFENLRNVDLYEVEKYYHVGKQSATDIFKKIVPKELNKKEIATFLLSMRESDIIDSIGHYFIGQYITALVLQSSEDKITLNLTENYKPIQSLGQDFEEKTLIINGNVGKKALLGIKSGKVVINGDAGLGFCAFAKGGTVEINGDCKNSAGFKMENGDLTINGSVYDIGSSMTGGNVTVNGYVYDKVGCFMEGGKIEVTQEQVLKISSTHKSGTIEVKGDRYYIK